MDAEKFGKFISNQRKALGMTQADLGGRLNVTDKAVSKWERGLGFPDINSLTPLADALHVSMDELMSGEKNVAEAASNEAILNTISIADDQLKKAEKRNIIRSVAVVAAVMLLVLIVDNSEPWSLALIGFFVYVPITCGIAGIILLLYGLYLMKKGKPYKATFRAGLVLIAVVAAVMMLVFLAGVFAFPGQQ